MQEENSIPVSLKKGRLHRSPLALPRAHGPENYRIVRADGSVYEINAHTFDIRHDFTLCIRILDEEYKDIDGTLPYFTHFNLEYAGNPIGGRAFLPRIITRGYFRATGDEVLPTCSFANIYTGTVVRKREYVPYEALHAKIFQYSMKHIKNVDELKQAILRRYRVSMPNLSDEEILKRGVGITTIRLEGTFTA